MKWRVVRLGKGRTPWADAAVADYTSRLRRYGGLEEVLLRPEVFRGDVDAVQRAEGERVRALLGPRDLLVVLDERGEAPDTPTFARWLDEARQRGGATFALGGPYGHHATLRAEAWRVARLSNLVLNHEVARVLFFEQLYRGLSLLDGSPYHHA
jgi:23S rRNA (pseudouridine1915-N3)-methyltransferase